MPKRIAIIMAGGSGQRFWPASTWEKPKPFLSTEPGGPTLIQMAAGRADEIADITCIATMRHLVEACQSSLPTLQEGMIFTDPAKRNTAGALVWATAELMAQGHEDAAVAVLTADHLITPLAGFAATARKAFALADAGYLVTIGIKPDRPETGFGYIERGEAEGDGWRVATFREKPDLATAEEYVKSGQFSWNSGMFFWTISAFRTELEAAQPAMAQLMTEMAALLATNQRPKAQRLFEDLESISIDYALMEKSDKVAVVEAEFEWDDLGAWDSLPRISGTDEMGNTKQGPGVLLDSTNCIVRSDGDMEICLLGCEDMIVVAAGNKILAAPRSKAQEVKRLAELFEKRKR